MFDLNAADFNVYEDGQLQPIRSFSRESYLPTSPSLTAAAAPRMVEEGISGQQRYLSIILDDLTLANPKLARSAVDALKTFVSEQMTERDLVSIQTASGRVRLPFTGDRKALLYIIEGMPEQIQMTGSVRSGCPVLTDLQAQNIRNNHPDGSSLEVAILETILCERLERNPNATEIATTLVRSRAMQQHEEVHYRNRLLLESVQQHLRSLRRIEGRKSVVLFSDGFLPEDLRFELQDVIDAALRAGVILNAIDLRGLYAGSYKAEDRVLVGKTGGEHIVLAQKARMQSEDLSRQLSPLRQVTSDTGGLFVHSHNDLSQALRSITGSQSFYYVISYASPASDSDGRYHRIRVEVSRPGVRLVHREGYFAAREQLTYDRRRKEDILEALKAPADLTDIPVNLSFKSSQLDSDLIQLAVLARVQLKSLRFIDEDSRHRNLIHLVVVALDGNGQYVDGIARAIQFNLTEPAYAGLLRQGLVSRVNMNLPPGQYRVQAVVRESVQARIGSTHRLVQIP
jgi:VWFA-related protein